MDLKHYCKYIKCIRLYTKAIQLRLEFKETPYGGVFFPSRRLIRIDPGLSESKTVAALLHELGHVLDDTIVSSKKFRQMEKAYAGAYSKQSKKQAEVVYRTELRAWEYGRVVAKILGIKVGKWYNAYRRECLKGYRNER